jgi:voltage-gated sodium channel
MKSTGDSKQPGLRDAIRRWVESPPIQHGIMSLIVINAIILGLETVPSVMSSYGGILLAVDHFILAAFVIEILLRIFVHRLVFFAMPGVFSISA